ncbi:phospholipase A2 inhibitor and Ly6/PLAUR domain-containing protein-like [Choloepus didactylus]|uniref:phospholipase A2 inhibitor and Ly6/PLAUR domain-containing protein-like n=1 Tax=Choloepus didactylus TaxID=27675 RepID=UPI00189D3E79|nr:phospholipase A2 inhibitor and Ly6/PLAUR domain-containing protein-like [Choloepus didactylus]
MLRLIPALALLAALGAPAGTSRTCPACSLKRECTEIVCPSAQDSCSFSQMFLENGALIENGSCVAPGECREGIYALTYGPNSSLWVNTTCCENNCSRPTMQEAVSEAQPNAVRCHYCSGDNLAPCDSLSVISCTGNQTVCVTLNGTWSGGKGSLARVS